MATLVRNWNPGREFAAMERAMDHFFNTSRVRRTAAAFRSVALDVYESGDTLMVEAVVPGIAPEAIELTIEEGVLTVKGDVSDSVSEGDESDAPKYYLRERYHGSFSRSIRLPEYVDAEAAEAKFENGILRVAIPKAEAAKPRQIPVSVS